MARTLLSFQMRYLIRLFVSDRANIGASAVTLNLRHPPCNVHTIVVIGNAKVAGLASDLHLTGVQFNLCVAITLVSLIPLAVADFA